jgi:hypothetical protein
MYSAAALRPLSKCSATACVGLEEAARQKRFREFELREAESWSGDTSAPGEVDVSQLRASRARDAKVRKQLEERAARRADLDDLRWRARLERRRGGAS